MTVTTRIQFAQLVKETLPPIQRLESHLAALLAGEDHHSHLEQAITDLKQLQNIATQLLAIQTFTLYETEYLIFCDLIICGSEMATQFADNPNASKTMQKHGQYWQKSVKEFKSFLKEVLTKYPTNI